LRYSHWFDKRAWIFAITTARKRSVLLDCFAFMGILAAQRNCNLWEGVGQFLFIWTLSTLEAPERKSVRKLVLGISWLHIIWRANKFNYIHLCLTITHLLLILNWWNSLEHLRSNPNPTFFHCDLLMRRKRPRHLDIIPSARVVSCGLLLINKDSGVDVVFSLLKCV
jgi:hypothetical protein